MRRRTLIAASAASLLPWRSAHAVTGITIADPFLANNQQIVPPLNGILGASPAIVTGTYTGAAPAGIEVQITAAVGGAIVQAWTALTNATIAGGAWSGTLSVPWTAQMYKAQARAADAHSIQSLVTTSTFGAGPTPLLVGQSQIQRMWGASGEFTAATMLAASKATTGWSGSQVLFGPYLNGKTAFSTNLTGGQSVIASNSSPNTVTLSDFPLVDQNGTADISLEIAPIVAGAASMRTAAPFNGGVNQVGHAPVGNEAVVVKANGEIELANLLATNFGSGSMLIEQALGGAVIADLTSPNGGQFKAVQSILGANGLNTNDFDRVFLAQGGSDTLPNNGPTSGPVYLAGLMNFLAWTRGFRANCPVFVAPFGIVPPVGRTTDAAADAIRQQLLYIIDTQPNVFWGGQDIDLEHATNNEHLSPAGQIPYAKRIVQAMLRQAGLSPSGYGSQLASVAWDGNVTVTATVNHEVAGATLTSAGLSSSGAGLTGFAIFGRGGTQSTVISATAFVQPDEIVFTLAAPPFGPVALKFLGGANPDASHIPYDNQAPLGDSNGLPLQNSRGPLMIATNTALKGRASQGIRMP